jgi:LytS/YehU family sensor histidine kinase
MPYRLVMETLKLSTGFFVVYLIYIFYESNKEKQAEKLKAVKLEEQLTRTRLEFLKNQIHPHFLFNTLNMISSVMYESVPEADRMIANLSDLLRMTLKTSGAGVHTLSEEIKILKFYLEIMEARFKDKLEIFYSVDKDVLDALVPSFLLQPLVENSIKYGMENLSTVKIEIGAKKVNSLLSITVKDNGPGIHIEPENVLKRGVGLSNTQERLEKLYGNDFVFTWQNIPTGGLLIEITFPFSTGNTE